MFLSAFKSANYLSCYELNEHREQNLPLWVRRTYHINDSSVFDISSLNKRRSSKDLVKDQVINIPFNLYMARSHLPI